MLRAEAFVFQNVDETSASRDLRMRISCLLVALSGMNRGSTRCGRPCRTWGAHCSVIDIPHDWCLTGQTGEGSWARLCPRGSFLVVF